MGLYGIKVSKDKNVLKIIKKVNYRLKGGDGTNHGLMFISGKISFIASPRYKDHIILICNIRPFINLPFFKTLFKFAMYRSLKKAGYIGSKPRYIGFSDLSRVLEGIL